MITIVWVWICLASFIGKVVPFKPHITTPDGVEGGGVGYSAHGHRFNLQQGSLRNGPDAAALLAISFVDPKADSYGYGGDKEDIYPIEGSEKGVYPWEKYCCNYINDNMVDDEIATEESTDDTQQYGKEVIIEKPFKENPLRPLWFNSYISKNNNRETKDYFPLDERTPDIATPPTYTKPLTANNYRNRFLNKVNVNFKTLVGKRHSLVPSISSKSSNAEVNKFDSEVEKDNYKNTYYNNNDALLTEDSNDGAMDTKFTTRKRVGTKNYDRTLISQNFIKFPENEIVSSVYNMIGKANSLYQLDDEDKIMLKASDPTKTGHNFEATDTIEPLPEAQRRYADERMEYNIHSSNEVGKWDFKSVHFTTVSIGTLMIFLILVVMVLALRVHCRNREKTAQEWIRHPVVQPSTAASDAIQPNLKHILHPDHLHTEPIRIKAKGLLERRGSNTSLTIDLGPGSERADGLFSPSRECTPEDFLMTAGSRMSRRQLRNCLKDPRDLHAEFWQIPTNHPDKCGVPGAAAKNRYRTVLPNEETRVVLHKAPPDSPETPASQYINANYIRGYEGEERAYVATQGPLAHTIEDLWLLVLQERSPAIVMITRLKEKGRVKCEPYIPSYSATYGSLSITVKQVIQKNGYTIRQIYMKRGDEVHTTLHFWFTSWPDHKAPSSARHLLAMASEVEQARKETRGPVVVHCSAGIGRTGCFIGVSIGRIQLLEEDCVDVLSIVCQMRLDRGGMVQTAEQYEFIHRALALYEASLPMTASAE